MTNEQAVVLATLHLIKYRIGCCEYWRGSYNYCLDCGEWIGWDKC